MTTIDHAVTTALTLLSKDSTDPKVVRDIIAALLREDISLEAIVKFLIKTGHHREKADLPEKPTVDDLRALLQSLRDPSPENREIWADRFNSGHARYMCPSCGYAGDGDDFKTPDSGGSIVCTTCGCFKNVRYFTRTSPDELAAYEAEQQRLRPLRLAQEQREREKRQRALDMEPKVNAVLQTLDGVGDYVNEAEERDEVGPYVRAVVHGTTLPVERIVSEWTGHVATYKMLPQSKTPEHEFAARRILRGFSMKEVLDNIDNYEPSELEPLGAGEERHLFTRDEFVHEMTVNTAKWQDLMDTRDLSTALGPDGKFAITVHAKGYAEAHPCLCADCKAMTESNPTKAGHRAA